jgi:hypothetical protein
MTRAAFATARIAAEPPTGLPAAVRRRGALFER